MHKKNEGEREKMKNILIKCMTHCALGIYWQTWYKIVHENLWSNQAESIVILL